MIGKKAPAIRATAVVNGNEIVQDFTLGQYEGKKYVVLFFYPMDFTFVCPTELHAFQEKLGEFEARGVQVVGCSVDSEYSHLAWLGQPRNRGGIEGVKYPIIADTTKTISENYGVLGGEDLSGGIVRHMVINDLPLGRSVDEVIRMVDALQHFEEYGEVCPANWAKGKDAMSATGAGVSDYLSRH